LTEIFPSRTAAPETLVFAKDDSHADDIAKIVREERLLQKITLPHHRCFAERVDFNTPQ
jgi:type I site-specific restriction endonuclease